MNSRKGFILRLFRRPLLLFQVLLLLVQPGLKATASENAEERSVLFFDSSALNVRHQYFSEGAGRINYRVRVTGAARFRMQFGRTDRSSSCSGLRSSHLRFADTRNQQCLNGTWWTKEFQGNDSTVDVALVSVRDRSGEDNASFSYCIELDESVDPQPEIAGESCQELTIIDDDSVVLALVQSRDIPGKVSLATDGLINGPVEVSEGQSVDICAHVAEEGLALDPFDSIPVRLTSSDKDAPVLSGRRFNRLFKVCWNLRFAADRRVSGTEPKILNYRLRVHQSTVPVNLVNPDIQILVNEGDYTRFSPVPEIVRLAEGERQTVSVRREGTALIDQYVNFSAELFGLMSPLVFLPNDSQQDINLQIHALEEDDNEELRDKYLITLIPWPRGVASAGLEIQLERPGTSSEPSIRQESSTASSAVEKADLARRELLYVLAISTLLMI